MQQLTVRTSDDLEDRFC